MGERQRKWLRHGDHYSMVETTGVVGKDRKVTVFSMARDSRGEQFRNRVAPSDLYDNEAEVVEAIVARLEKRITRHASRLDQAQRAQKVEPMAEAIRSIGRALAESEGITLPGEPRWLLDVGSYGRVYVVGGERKDGKTPVVEYEGGPVTFAWSDRLYEREEDVLAEVERDSQRGGEILLTHRNKLIERLYALRHPQAPQPPALSVEAQR